MTTLQKQLLITAFFTAAFALVPITDVAAQTNLAGFQIADSGCGSAGSATYAPNITGSWSSWEGDGDDYDGDCMRIYLDDVAIPANTDFRIWLDARDINTPCGLFWCCKCGDGPNGGTERATPWASEIAAGAVGWMGFVGDTDMFDADQYRIRIESRATSTSITGFRLALQLGDTSSVNGGGTHCYNYNSGIQYTPWNTTMGGGRWSSWINRQNFDCARIGIEAIAAVPTATLYAQNTTTGDPETTGSLSITTGDSVSLRWESTNASGCSATAGTGFSASGSSGTDSDITEPVDTSAVFTVECTGAGGTASSSVTITASTPPPPPSPPNATLEARNVTTGGGWSSQSEMQIGSEDQVEMQWSSTDATSCTKTFTSGTATSSGPVAISEPYAGESDDYTVSCTGPGGGPVGDTISITVASSTPTLTVNDSDKLVRKGDTVEFSWDLNGNDPAGCSFSGPGAPASVAGADNPFTVAIQGASTYLLTCDGGTAQVRMQILPDIHET
jgi:hypothetical protein